MGYIILKLSLLIWPWHQSALVPLRLYHGPGGAAPGSGLLWWRTIHGYKPKHAWIDMMFSGHVAVLYHNVFSVFCRLASPLHTFIHTYIHTYMFVVVNFDALAQASDFRIERRQVVFLCWMQDSKLRSLEPNLQQTECPLTNRLSHRGSS